MGFMVSSYRPAQAVPRQYSRLIASAHHRDHLLATRASPPPESDRQVTLTDLHRCVWVCTASLTGTTGIPPTTSRSESGMRCQRSSSSERTSGFAPPPKSRRPEGFPKAGTGPATGRPAPLEEGRQEGGWDESSMAPEFVVTLPEAWEDLNLQPVTMDRDWDSPHPLSPRQTASLDRAVEETVSGSQGTDLDTEVLHEVPSTQPATPPPSRDPSSRVIVEKLQTERVPRTRSRTRHLQVTVPPPAHKAPTFADYAHIAGRGIMRLRPTEASMRTSASMPTTSVFCFAYTTMDTCIATNTDHRVYGSDTTVARGLTVKGLSAIASQQEPSQFQDADEDPVPLSGSWADIVDEEK